MPQSVMDLGFEARMKESIPVFALSRNKNLQWNPDPQTQLRYDDVIIFYGPTKALRTALKSVTHRTNDSSPNASQDIGDSIA